MVDDPLAMYLVDLYTVSANLAGIPGICFPCGFTKRGLPIGLQLQGPPFEEERLLRAAHMFQQATDWHTRRAADWSIRDCHPIRDRTRTPSSSAWKCTCSLPRETKLFCGCSTKFGAAAEHADLPGLHRHAGHAAGDESRGVRAVAEDGAWR